MAALDNGPLIIPINYARQMIADSYYWRRLVDPNTPWDDATSFAHTHIDAVDSPADRDEYTDAELTALRPFAIVYQADGDGYEAQVRTMRPTSIVGRGHLVVHVQMNTPTELSNDESALGAALNVSIGQLIWTDDPAKPGFLDLAGEAGYMTVSRIVCDAYQRTPEEQRISLGDFIMFDMHVYWGQDS